MHEEWERALDAVGSSLWTDWLDWRSRLAPEGVEGIVQDAQRALSALGAEEELEKLRVFWRIAVTLREAGTKVHASYVNDIEYLAGYTERSGALFQAQAEL